MLTAVRQRRIVAVLVTVSVFYFCLLARNYLQEEAAWEHLRSVHGKVTRALNQQFGWQLGQQPEEELQPPPKLYPVNCSSLFENNHREIDQTVQFLATNPPQVTPNDWYLKATENCEKFAQTHGFTDLYGQVPLKFPTAYIISVARSVHQFELLLHSIYNEHNVYCVHIDGAADAEFRLAVEAVVNCIPKVFVATRSERIVRFDHSELRAEFHCMRDLLTLPIHWRYVLNLEETSFPLKTSSQTTDRLKELGEYNIASGKISISDDRLVRYKYHHTIIADRLVQTQQLKSTPPLSIQLLHGSPYYALSRNFVQFIMSNYYSIEYFNWLNDTYAPREMFWATMNLAYMTSQNLDQTKAPRREGTHYYKIRTSPTGEVATDAACPGRFHENVCTFGASALSLLRYREELFASRFDIAYDHTPLVCIDTVITNPYNLS